MGKFGIFSPEKLKMQREKEWVFINVQMALVGRVWLRFLDGKVRDRSCRVGYGWASGSDMKCVTLASPSTLLRPVSSSIKWR